MKPFCVLLLALALICNGHQTRRKHVHSIQLQFPSLSAPKADLCPTCVEFASESIDNLINIIANVGVVGGCSSVCNILANDTHSEAIGVVCDLLCSYVGIKEFVKIVEDADLDPIYFCELVRVCPIFDNGDAELVNITITPPQGPQGTKFQIDVVYSTQNGTGTGEFDIDVDTVDHIPVGSSHLMERQSPGTHDLKVTLDAKPDPNCDPTQQICEQWLPGNYTVKVALCNGECGSKHPHSQIYFEGSSGFVLTE